MRSPTFLTAFLLTSVASLSWSQNVSLQDAKNHVGETATVCGKIAGKITAPSSEGARTFISLGSAYPHQVFTIVVWEEDQKEIGPLPAEGARICATGKVTTWRGVPQIVARYGWQISQ